MPLDVPNLDDRRFDDLVTAMRSRLAAHVPEWSPMAEGDPAAALVDLFAWLAESIAYRANRIPERQRRAFLRLLHVPLRAATPARGLVALEVKELATAEDVAAARTPPALVPTDVAVDARGGTTFRTTEETRPLPVALGVALKRRPPAAAKAAAGDFVPGWIDPAREEVDLADSVDGVMYLDLAVAGPRLKGDLRAAAATNVRVAVGGVALAIGLAPPVDEARPFEAVARFPRTLAVDVWTRGPRRGASRGASAWVPLATLSDSSEGGRRAGVLRVRLPADPDAFDVDVDEDPARRGLDDAPPDPAPVVAADLLVARLRLRDASGATEDGTFPAFRLAYVAINAVPVENRVVRRGRILGVGDGSADFAVALPDRAIDRASLELATAPPAGPATPPPEAWPRWRLVESFGGAGPDDRVFLLDDEAGVVRFGDGVRGARPAPGERVVALKYLAGGGAAGNLPAGSLTALRDRPAGAPRLLVRQERPTTGGADAATVDEAEREIPAFLRHRGRAVTVDDFRAIAAAAPGARVGRVEVRPRVAPTTVGVRDDAPGAVAVFVLPRPSPSGGWPKPDAALLRDVYAALAPRTLIGTELYVLSPRFVQVAIALRVRPYDAARETETLRAAEDAARAHLWPLPESPESPGGRPFGARVDPREIATAVSRSPLVRAVDAVRLWTRGADGAWAALAEDDSLVLADYDLPEPVAVSASTGAEGFEPGAPPPGAAPERPAGRPRFTPRPPPRELC